MNPNPTPSEASSEVKFEIGHVLFIDIVGYSKLLINEQSEHMQTLREIGSICDWVLVIPTYTAPVQQNSHKESRHDHESLIC